MARHGLSEAALDSPPAFDFQDPATFPHGGITEIIPPGTGSAAHLLLASFLRRETPNPSVPTLALIDGRDSFDPDSFSPLDCSKLLWIRCNTSQQAMKAADLLLRDGNVPRVIIDLLALPKAELRSIPDSSWHRLNQLVQTSDLSVIVISPHVRVPCARLRLFVQSRFGLDHLVRSREELLGELQVRMDLEWKRAL